MRRIGLEQMAGIESAAREEVCLVLTAAEVQHLTLRTFAPIVTEGLARGVLYRYLVADDPRLATVFRDFEAQVLAARPPGRLCHVLVNPRALGLLSPVALFDPNLADGRGFLRMLGSGGYSWLELDRARLDLARDGFEYFWRTQPIVGRFWPEAAPSWVPEVVRVDYTEAVHCRLLGQHRAAVTLFARVVEGALRIHAEALELGVESTAGLGKLLGEVSKADPGLKRPLGLVGHLINQYRIENVHPRVADERPSEADVDLVASAVRKLLELLPSGNRP